jgi:chromate transport protein ChrA
VKPTSWRSLLGGAILAGILGWVLFAAAYGSLVKLPTYAAVTAGLMAVFELVLARVVRDKVRGVHRGRQMHPLQIARAAALAKASSMAGALLFGLYAGFFTWLLPRGERRRPRRRSLRRGVPAARRRGTAARAGMPHP